MTPRPLAAEHRSLRAALARLEAAASTIALPANDELSRAAAHARVVLAKVSAIGNPGRPPKSGPLASGGRDDG